MGAKKVEVKTNKPNPILSPQSAKNTTLNTSWSATTPEHLPQDSASPTPQLSPSLSPASILSSSSSESEEEQPKRKTQAVILKRRNNAWNIGDQSNFRPDSKLKDTLRMFQEKGCEDLEIYEDGN